MRISPLRQRMIGDMTARHFSEKAQKDYIRSVKNLAAFIGRPPETATAEDLRLYRLHLVQSPLGASSVNSYMTALRFFFSITLDRYDLLKPLFRVEQPLKLPGPPIRCRHPRGNRLRRYIAARLGSRDPETPSRQRSIGRAPGRRSGSVEADRLGPG